MSNNYNWNSANNFSDEPGDGVGNSEQNQEQEETQAPNPPPLKDFVKIEHGKSHVFWPPFETGQNGENESALSEPIPEYFARTGDCIINAGTMKQGVDNNTMIILGRDRTGIGEKDTILTDKNSKSGYSNYMGAGQIDLVAGRMAPFPVELPGYSLGPLYLTHHNIPELKMELLSGKDPTDFITFHPGYAMDASRILISQMTNIDENFAIDRDPEGRRPYGYANRGKDPAASAIMLKSDKIRFHSRQDIKIVNGVGLEERNSQGNEILRVGGIHLMANNCSYPAGRTQPIPKGGNLLEAMNKMMEQMYEICDILFKFMEIEQKFTKVLEDHVHISPVNGKPTSFSPSVAPAASVAINQIRAMGKRIEVAEKRMKNFQNQYLRAGGNFYVNSYYNTTN